MNPCHIEYCRAQKHKAARRITLECLLTRRPQSPAPASAPAPVIPLDFRVDDVNADENGQHFTKNDHFRAMASAARTRGLRPDCVVFDSWYGGLDNLKHIRKQEMHFLTRLKSNRRVNPDRSGLVEVSTLQVATQGQVVQLRSFGLVRVFHKADAKGQPVITV